MTDKQLETFLKNLIYYLGKLIEKIDNKELKNLFYDISRKLKFDTSLMNSDDFLHKDLILTSNDVKELPTVDKLTKTNINDFSDVIKSLDLFFITSESYKDNSMANTLQDLKNLLNSESKLSNSFLDDLRKLLYSHNYDSKLSIEDFAVVIAKVLQEDYGSHLYTKFFDKVKNSL